MNMTMMMMMNFFFSKIVVLYEIMCKSTVDPDRATDDNMGACALDAGYLMPHTRSEYILLIAYPLQQMLQ
jgi:hypothetical protein